MAVDPCGYLQPQLEYNMLVWAWFIPLQRTPNQIFTVVNHWTKITLYCIHNQITLIYIHLYIVVWLVMNRWPLLCSVATQWRSSWWRASLRSISHVTDISTYSLWISMLAFDSGGLACVLILTGGRWASALAGRTGTWLSKPKPSPALPAAWCSHGLAVFWTHNIHVHTSIEY